eukprot:2956839-Amphidinium_carterae.1
MSLALCRMNKRRRTLQKIASGSGCSLGEYVSPFGSETPPRSPEDASWDVLVLLVTYSFARHVPNVE